MVKAFLMVNADLGKEDDTVNRIRNSEGVEECMRTNGAYDMIVKVDAKDHDHITSLIAKIRAVPSVRSVLALMRVEM